MPQSDDDRIELRAIREIEQSLRRRCCTFLGHGHKVDVFIAQLRHQVSMLCIIGTIAEVALRVRNSCSSSVFKSREGGRRLIWPICLLSALCTGGRYQQILYVY
jgi:hypothetical protein